MQPRQSRSPHTHMANFLAAVRALNRDELEMALTRASLTFARPVLIEQFLIPLLHKMGELWSTGSLRIVHEHSASAVLRALFGGLLTASGLSQSSPILVTVTPAGQSHEFGAKYRISPGRSQIIARAEGFAAAYPSEPPRDRGREIRQCLPACYKGYRRYCRSQSARVSRSATTDPVLVVRERRNREPSVLRQLGREFI